MRTYLLLAALLLISPALAQDAATFAKQLADADAAKREAAATGLAELGPQALPALEELLAATKDKAFKVRVASVRALVAIGPKASEACHERLLELLQDKSAQVREEAAKALAQLGLASKSLPQLGGLFGDQKWRVRAAAVEAVGSTGAAAEPLSEELRSLSTGDASASVRKLATAAYGKLQAALGGTESKPQPQPGPSAAPKWTVTRLPGLLAAIREGGDAHFDALRDLRSLGPLAASALPDLLELLADPTHAEHHNPYVYAIADFGDAAAPAVPVLAARLKLKGKMDRFAAAEALGMLGPSAKAAVPSMLEAWDATTESSLRRALAMGFAGIGPASRPALERLVTAYPDADREGQEEMGAALAALGLAGAKFLLSRAADPELSAKDRARALYAAASSRGAEAEVVRTAWLALKSDAKEDWEGGSLALQRLSEWSPSPLEKLKVLAEQAKTETNSGRARVLKQLVEMLESNQLLHSVVKQDPATPAAIPALIKGLEKGGYWPRKWLEVQAKRSPKVVEALWAQVGQKTKGPAYSLLSSLTGLKHGEPAPRRGDAGPESAARDSAAGDLSHVKVGQVYVYELEAGGTKMQMKYIVEKVDATSVHYGTEVIVAGNTSKSPSTIWKAPDPKDAKATPPAKDAKTRFEAYEFQGESWETMVVESSGTTTWILLKGGAPTFPPFVKTEGASKITLVKIEQP